jgi:outer membrane autotransporter protein
MQNTDNFGSVAGNANVAPFNQSNYGFLAGYDAPLTKEFTGGVMGGYVHTSVTAQDSSSKTGVDGYQLAVYGSGHWDNWEAGWVVGYGLNHFAVNRTITLSGGNAQVRGAYDGSQLTAALQGDYLMDVSGISVKPLAGVQWSQMDENAFTETGSSTINLVMPSQSYDSLRPYIGVDGSKGYDMGGKVTLTPMVNLSLSDDLNNSVGQFKAAFSGAPGSSFTVAGITPSALLFGLGAGVQLSFDAPFKLFANYNGYFSGTETLNNFNGGVNLSF